MRITINKGFRPLIEEVMQQIGVTEPKLAVNHIIGSWAAGQTKGQQTVTPDTPATTEDDEFSSLTDWS